MFFLRKQLMLVCARLHLSYMLNAIADKLNPAYVAIEKKTLEALCPFLELGKRPAADRQETETQLSSSPAVAQNHGQRYETPSSFYSHDSTVTTGPRNRDRTSSLSSLSYEDFRSHVRTTSSSQYSPEIGYLQDQSQSSPLIHKPCRKNSLTRGSLDLTHGHSSPSMPFNIFGQGPLTYQAMNTGYALNSLTSQQMKVVEGRLRSLSTSSVRSRRDSLVSTMTALQGTASFALTTFVHESVRLFSPTTHELDEKLRLKHDFESILQAIQPTAELVVFGSVKNSLNLANADLDLMVVDDSPAEDHLHDLQIDIPQLYAEALRGQGYCVKLLAKTRIPLIKVQRDYVGGTFSCDICFDTPLALHNTRLIATYAACDSRVSILMMFVKLWARAKKINDAFCGTLKSYGYMLLLIYYLQNKVSPAVLPNLQMIASTGRMVQISELECQGYDCWFSKDVSKVPLLQKNTNSIGELLEGFFSHFAHEFDYRDVRGC